MYVVVYNPETNEVLMKRELGPNERLSERHYAIEVADMYDAEIDEPNGYIPSCSGDIRVEFREDPENDLVIWSGESFYLKRDY